MGRPEEVGKLVVFLLSEDYSYVNGQVIAIDGGQSIHTETFNPFSIQALKAPEFIVISHTDLQD